MKYMRRPHPLIPIVLLGVCLHSTGCAANPVDTEAGSLTVTVVSADAFDDKAVKALTDGAKMEFTDNGEQGKVLISDRIFDGFQAGPWQVVIANGSALRWGFKYGEANIESVAIDDKRGHLKLLAAVGNVSRLTSVFGDQSPVESMTQYEGIVKRSGLEPVANVFVRDEADLKTYLPLLKRWLQADLMGLIGDCSKAELADACKLAEQIAIPTKAYLIAPEGSLHSIMVPDVKAASVPIKPFVQ